mmetsp:Transcript_41317/g.102736  ORF Transcript_41317/g.102736 Transcript_41317/m.102736 type:complete len:93 (+) Transcript_41317:66-344(+)
MLRALLVALCLGTANAYVPTTAGAKLALSKVTGSRPSFTLPSVDTRSSDPIMSAVTERDADGNPVTHYEMFDVFWLVIAMAPWLTLLVLNPF